MNKSILALALTSTLAMTGCASIISDSTYPVSITSNPDGARFTITNKDGDVVHNGTTPNTVILQSGSGYFSGENYKVTFTLDGHASQTAFIKAEMDGWYVGNILFGGLIGLLIVDPATGAMYKLPSNLSTNLSATAQAADSDTPSLSVMTINQVPENLRDQLQTIR